MIRLPNFIPQKLTKKVLAHIFCWSLFLIYEQVLVVYNRIDTGPLLTIVYFYLCNICLFYVHFYILQKTIVQPSPKYLPAIILIILETVIFLFLKLAGDYFLVFPAIHPPNKWLSLKKFMGLDLYRNIGFAGLSTIYWLGRQYGAFRRRAAEARIKHLISEKDNAALQVRLAESHNAFLQQQLNPHLLFNTLNFIYSQVFKHSAEGAESVLLLGELMRYSMQGAGPDGKVALSEEIRQLENLMAINRHRVGKELQLTTTITNHFDQGRIIPLSLLTLTENIFKHGKVDDPTQSAQLSITVNPGGKLIYQSQNAKRRNKNERTSGIGLANLKIRLDYMYKEQYHLHTTDKDGIFETLLTINL